MADQSVHVSIGPNSGSLTKLSKAILSDLELNRVTQTKNRTTYHGKRNVVVAGQKKRAWAPKFTNVLWSDFIANYESYGQSSRKFYVQIGNDTGLTLFSGYAYIEINDVVIPIAIASDARTAFTFLVFEV
jgi:hypothetical protein